MKLSQVYATYDWKGNRGLDKFKYCSSCGAQLSLTQMGHKSRLFCPSCGLAHYQNPYPTVSILIIHENKVLLGKRLGELGSGKWALPSGYIEFEDDFLGAAVREVKEETGFDIEVVSILNVQSAFLPPAHHFLSIFVLGKVMSGKLCAGDDLETVEWFPLAGPLPEMAFQPDVDLIQACVNDEVNGIPVHPPFREMK